MLKLQSTVGHMITCTLLEVVQLDLCLDQFGLVVPLSNLSFIYLFIYLLSFALEIN